MPVTWKLVYGAGVLDVSVVSSPDAVKPVMISITNVKVVELM